MSLAREEITGRNGGPFSLIASFCHLHLGIASRRSSRRSSQQWQQQQNLEGRAFKSTPVVMAIMTFAVPISVSILKLAHSPRNGIQCPDNSQELGKPPHPPPPPPPPPPCFDQPVRLFSNLSQTTFDFVDELSRSSLSLSLSLSRSLSLSLSLKSGTPLPPVIRASPRPSADFVLRPKHNLYDVLFAVFTPHETFYTALAPFRKAAYTFFY
jgi:hypothetical protein